MRIKPVKIQNRSNNMHTQSLSSEANFDLFRLSKSKRVVDVCSNTLRKYHEQGLQFYRRGKAVFVSKTELAMFIRAGAAGTSNKAPAKRGAAI
jgi:hypothetical protein